MAPGSDERQPPHPPPHTGTVPKTKVRNCVPQEAVTPTRRDINSANLAPNSLDWVPVPSGSEYNPRPNYIHSSRKTTNSNIVEHDFSDIENSLESALQRFVPVRPQPRGLPPSMQPSAENGDDSLQPYHQSTPNGVSPHINHGAAAVMIVNPTTPNTLAANMTSPYNVSANASRNNLARSLHTVRHAEGAGSRQSPAGQPSPHTRVTKNNNIDTNVFDSQPRVNGHASTSGLGDALLAACPDPATVERRLGQIREYIRVTSSLVDTMRNSEDEAFIEHTKEEYDELVEMVEKLKESESKLKCIVDCTEPDNREILTDSEEGVTAKENAPTNPCVSTAVDEPCKIETKDDSNETGRECMYEDIPKVNTEITVTLVKKVSNIENEHRNENIHGAETNIYPDVVSGFKTPTQENHDEKENADDRTGNNNEILSTDHTKLHNENQEVKEFIPKSNNNTDENLNAMLRKDIESCAETLAAIEMHKEHQIAEECPARPMSVQSTGSGYSDNDLWHSELKAKMEVSQQRLAALQDQQKRLLKYQAEAKQHLADMQQLARERQAHDNRHRRTPTPDNAQNQVPGANQQQLHRLYNTNQIGIATTLPHNNNTSNLHAGGSGALLDGTGVEADSTSHNAHHDDRFATRDARATSSNVGDEDGDAPCEAAMNAHSRELQHTLQDLHRRKQHMESLVAERALGAADAHNNNTYSSDDSGAEDITPHKGMQKNEDPFNMLEIIAIKAALQKTKDLMRTVERYDASDSGLNEDFQMPSHSNINDNKSEGGRSAGEWSTEGSVCRSIRNSIQTGKLTNRDNRAHGGCGGADSREASISSLQLLTQQLRQEAEQVAGERQRLRQAVSRNKDGGNGKLSKKKLLRCGSSGSGAGGGAAPGSLERTQHALRAELAEKQRQLATILNKQKELVNASEVQNIKQESCSYAINQSYNSEQEEGESQVDDIFPTHPHSQSEQHYQNADGNAYADGSSVPPPPSHGNYFSDSDNGSRCKSDTRSLGSRCGRPLLPDRVAHQHVAGVPVNSMPDPVPPPHPLHSQTGESSRSTPSFPPAMPPPHPPPPPAWSNKSNQDSRSNQFTTNSHSQTSLEQLFGMQHAYPPSLPFNVMMPYGAFQGTGGACGCWGVWCWQQLAAQQREIQQLREQLSSLEERWRAEAAPHALNNQVPPGNRANNYWDNFRSYSRQNLLSAHSKTNADGHRGGAPPQPLAARSHNALHPQPPPPGRDNRHAPRAPDVLNHEPEPARLNRAEPAPEIVQAHANNLAESVNEKKKSSSKLPAKNSAIRRHCSLDFVQNDNINIASSSQAPNPNLASVGRDKATSKVFDLMRESVYSEVTALISANESHPDFLLQLFRDLQNVSSDAMRRNALQSIRQLMANNHAGDGGAAAPTATSDRTSAVQQTLANRDGAIVFRDIVDFMITHGEEICTPDLLEAFKLVIINVHLDAAQSMPYSQKKLQEFLSKYEGARLREVSGHIIDDLMSVPSREEERRSSGVPDAVAAGSSSQEGTSSAYSWEGAAAEGSAGAGRLASEGRVDLIDCVEMYNGDLAEADQTCSSEPEPAASHEPADLLPDLVETEEITPTEAEAGWLGLDRVPTRLHTDDSSENQKD